LDRLREIIVGCVEGVAYKLIDMPWERLENLRDPMNMGYGFKFLTIYLPDFLENHEVIYGEEVAHLLPRYDQDTLLRWRAGRLKDMKLPRERPDLAPVVAGEVCRLMAIVAGAEDINKKTILSALKSVGDEQATEIYENYVENRKPDKSQEYYLEFIESRMRNIESTLGQRRDG